MLSQTNTPRTCLNERQYMYILTAINYINWSHQFCGDHQRPTRKLHTWNEGTNIRWQNEKQKLPTTTQYI